MADSPESPKFQDRVRSRLIAHHDEYVANSAVREALSNKMFTGIAGPFGVGKSMLTDEVIRQEPSIKPIHTTTTRRRKAEDPAGFKTADEGVTFASMLDAVREGELVNYSVIPNADIYGTYAEDFPADYTIGPFLPSSMDHIAQAGFNDYRFVYIVTPGELWRNYVEKSRRTMPRDRFNSRINEALSSIEFAMENPTILHFVQNENGEEGLQKSARTIADVALGKLVNPLDDRTTTNYLNEMQEVAYSLGKK